MCYKYNMKARYIVLALLLGICGALHAADNTTAAQIIASMRKNMADAPSVEAVYTISAPSGKVQGSATLAGKRFMVSTPEMSVWFDGKTQWVLYTSTNEVNVTEPTAAEVMASNPLAILADTGAHFKARRLTDVYGNRRVELIPTDAAATITKYVVTVDRQGWPAALAVYFDGGKSMALTIDRIAPSTAKAASAFSFPSAKFPGVEIVDLR